MSNFFKKGSMVLGIILILLNVIDLILLWQDEREVE